MKIGSRLNESLDALMSDVMPKADSSTESFIDALRNWYQQYLSGITHHRNAGRFAADHLLQTDANELPITQNAINYCRRLLLRYQSAELTWSVPAANGIIAELIVHRDWQDSCQNEQGDLKYDTVMDTGQIVTKCELCSQLLSLVGSPVAVTGNFRPALRSELIASGVMEETA